MLWAKRLAVAALVVAACYGLSAVLHDNVIEYVMRILLLCGINAILAVGLNLINGTTGQFSIGHAGFMAVGAYATAFSVIALEDRLFPGQGGALPVASGALVFNGSLLVGAACAAVFGLVVGVPTLRLRGDYLAIVTLGFGEILRLLFTNAQFLGGATGYSGGRPLGLPTYTNFFWVSTWAILLVILIGNFTYSSYGRALRAIREDEIAAEAMGIPTTRFKVLAFVLSAASAGIAGGLFAHLQSTIRPDDFKFDRSIDMVVMIIVGGLGSVTGAIAGAVFVGVTLELMRDFQQYRLVVYALMLVMIMLFRPQGAFGQHELGVLLRRKRRVEPGPGVK
ncbi:MAG TPA: branched-chain amino acid ABC transporter permease [Polyangiales bacterium]|nr:branched-chain amino acid ABC transporter permease [Polyangiales bacterium]